MTLRALRLAHFKAFAESQRIPLRPITLIFGPNSAGKSSVIHALALAHHALETGDLDVQRTTVGGESIDLGGFRQYVHRHEHERRVDLVLELDPTQLQGRVAQLLGSARELSLEVSIGAGFTSEQPTLFGDASREVGREVAVRSEGFTLRVDGEVLLAMSARRDGLLRLDRLEHEHPVLREIVTGLLALSTTTMELRPEDFEAVARALDELVPEISARVSGLLPHLQDAASSGEGEDSPRVLGREPGPQRRRPGARGTCLLPPHPPAAGKWGCRGCGGGDPQASILGSPSVLSTTPSGLFAAPRHQLVRRWRLRVGRGAAATRRARTHQRVAGV